MIATNRDPGQGVRQHGAPSRVHPRRQDEGQGEPRPGDVPTEGDSHTGPGRILDLDPVETRLDARCGAIGVGPAASIPGSVPVARVSAGSWFKRHVHAVVLGRVGWTTRPTSASREDGRPPLRTSRPRTGLRTASEPCCGPRNPAPARRAVVGVIADVVAFDDAGPAKGEPIQSSVDMPSNGVAIM